MKHVLSASHGKVLGGTRPTQPIVQSPCGPGSAPLRLLPAARTRHMLLIVAAAVLWSLALAAQPPIDGPQYTNGNTLVRPANYREWIFLGSGLGMTYDASAAGTTFTNVFVNPAAYRGFMDTGRWPDKSVFILEFRASATEAPPNTAGRFQTRLVGVEAEVKDARFPDGWAFYNFRGADSAAPLAGQDVASCVECHTKSTAVERTFVQFYPTLLEVARAKGTVKPGF